MLKKITKKFLKNSKIEYHNEIIKPDEHELKLHKAILKKRNKKIISIKFINI